MRKPKPPISAWIVEQRTRQAWKSEELARRLSVSESTVRGWEAGRSVSDPNLSRAAMPTCHLYGTPPHG